MDVLPGLAQARSEYENDANDRDPCDRCDCIGCRIPDTYCVTSCPVRDDWPDEPDDRGNGRPLPAPRWA